MNRTNYFSNIIFINFLFVFLSSVAIAQNKNVTTVSDTITKTSQWKHETDLAKAAFVRSLDNSLLTNAEKTFAADTFSYNYLFRLRMKEASNCTSCVGQNIYSLIESYTNLLHNYNELLLQKLSPNDQIPFKSEQMSWNDYFEKHKKLTQVLAKEEYSGGGDIQENLVANEIFNTLRSRLENIAHFYFCQID